jgi:hypothetical protein
MRIQKHPTPGTLANCFESLDKVPVDPVTKNKIATEEMTEAQFAAWLAAQPQPPEPPGPVPTNLPAWRIRAVLKQRGLLNNVKQLISSLPAEQKAIAEEQLVDSKFEREHPLINQLGAALNLSSKDLDDIFREADALV